MIASVHVADVGLRSALAVLRRAPKPGTVAGLRRADVGLAAPLRGSPNPVPQRRACLIAFWDDDEALDRFLAGHWMAAALAGGWRVRLEPRRVYGSWPGVP